MSRQFIEARVGDCGCPEEAWLVGGLDVTIHFENENGQQFADVFVDAGDWDVEIRYAGDPSTAREVAFQQIESWPKEP